MTANRRNTGLSADGRVRRPVTPVRVVVVRSGHHIEVPDQVATEEPMEIRAAGPQQRPQPIAVTMRTPGHDFELAAGFLYTEAVIAGRGDVAAVKYCDLPDDEEQRFNTVTVELTVPVAEGGANRSFAVNASCGVCGKSSIDLITVACPVLPRAPLVPRSLLADLPSRLRAQQKLFGQTGGLHAAAVFDASGTPVCVREDVGRHNAVDKVIGHALLADRLPLTGCMLMVSGRISFDIVQKAARAGLAVLAAVSAPSSLAVDAAERLGVTLAGFVRDDRFNLYCHSERIDLTR